MRRLSLGAALALAGLGAGPGAAQVANPLLDCSACHGGAGAAVDAETRLPYPALTGQPTRYLARQLRAYREGLRQHGQMTNTATLLGPGADGAAARLYGSVPAPRFDPPPAGTAEAGRRIAEQGLWEKGVPPCASCHMADPYEAARLAPNLEGQREGYILHELEAYASGARRSDSLGRMRGIAAAMSPQERADIAAWYAGFVERQE